MMVDQALMNATKEGNLSELKELLDKSAFNVNTTDASGRTLLHHAASNSQHEIVKCLMEYGADIMKTNDRKCSALHIAASRNDESTLEVILENVPRCKLRKLLDLKIKSNGYAAIHFAVKGSSCKNVCSLLEYGANYELKNQAGERPVDITAVEGYREFLRLIDASFTKARRGDESLHDDLHDCTRVVELLNCRDNEGRTIVQALINNEHYKIVTDLLPFRCGTKCQCTPTQCYQLFAETNRRREVEKLTETVRASREFWCEKRSAMEKLIQPLIGKNNTLEFRVVATHAGKIGCEAMERAHETLLAYRKFEGNGRTLTSHAAMKTLEEVLEVLGFDPEQLHVVVGKQASYWDKLPGKFRENIGWLINLMNCIVDATMFHLLHDIHSVLIFDAVRSEDEDRVLRLLERGGTCNALDQRRYTALSCAVEMGSEKMLRLMLAAGAKVTVCEGEIVSPVYLAIIDGRANILRKMLEYVEPEDTKQFIDCRYLSPDACGGSVLHVAARKGHFDVVKVLLRYGATYWFFDGDNCTPLDVSTSEVVSDFLRLVDECFHDAKEADNELVDKLKAMRPDELVAVTGARNFQGHTLAVVAAKANAKSIVGTILKMIGDAKRTSA